MGFALVRLEDGTPPTDGHRRQGFLLAVSASADQLGEQIAAVRALLAAR